MINQLCRDCPHLRSRQARPNAITTIYWCGRVGDGRKGTSIGCFPWLNTPHPKCPIKQKGGEDK